MRRLTLEPIRSTTAGALLPGHEVALGAATTLVLAATVADEGRVFLTLANGQTATVRRNRRFRRVARRTIDQTASGAFRDRRWPQ
jgi:hypothetical protein